MEIITVLSTVFSTFMGFLLIYVAKRDKLEKFVLARIFNKVIEKISARFT